MKRTEKNNTIKINNKEYSIKYTIRALFIFERITERPFKVETLLDNYIFFYSMILACNPDNPLDWDEYLDALDSDPTLFDQIQDVVQEEQKQSSLFNEKKGDNKGKKV